METGLGVQLKFDQSGEAAEDGEWVLDVKREIHRLRRCGSKGTLVVYLNPSVESKALSIDTPGKSKAAIHARAAQNAVLLVPMRGKDNSYVELGEPGFYPPLRDVVFSHKQELFVVLTNLGAEASTSDDDRQMQKERKRIPLATLFKQRASRYAIRKAFEDERTTPSNGTKDIAKVDGASRSTD
jgi:hypothetical protein